MVVIKKTVKKGYQGKDGCGEAGLLEAEATNCFLGTGG